MGALDSGVEIVVAGRGVFGDMFVAKKVGKARGGSDVGTIGVLVRDSQGMLHEGHDTVVARFLSSKRPWRIDGIVNGKLLFFPPWPLSTF